MYGKGKNNSVSDTISYLDKQAAGFGFSANYGLKGEGLPMSVEQLAQLPAEVQLAIVNNAGGSDPRYPNMSANSFIMNKTAGKSTFIVNISCAQTGTGAVGTYFPVMLFGGESFNNTLTPYLQVRSAGQVVSLAVVNGKNVIKFTYGTAPNQTTYTLDLGTAGEYPFILNSLQGVNKMKVSGIQMEISDVTQIGQLSSGFTTFYFDEFGKVESNDLTTPRDLYQYQSGGVFIPHEFPISGKEGVSLNMLNVNNLTTKLYVFATPLRG